MSAGIEEGKIFYPQPLKGGNPEWSMVKYVAGNQFPALSGAKGSKRDLTKRH
jgi:hypothetical protein